MVSGLENYFAKNHTQVAADILPAAAQNDKEPNRSPARGEDRWAQSGIKSLGIKDPALAQRLLSDPKAKQLLIQASDLTPGSKAHKKIMDQIQKGWGQ
jgi:hypothetical protein